MSDLYSAIFDFKVRMISSVAAPQPTSLTLRKFPPEIRDMIYKLTLVGSWKGKMPAFIITLRGDQELYHEALQVLYETNRFTLTRRNRRMSNVRLLPGMTGKMSRALGSWGNLIQVIQNHQTGFSQLTVHQHWVFLFSHLSSMIYS
jgi:hypothetical protein